MAQRTAAGRMKVALTFLLLFGPASILVFIATRGCEHKFKELDDYGIANDYSFTDLKGKTRTFKEFEGDVVLVTTLQTTCPDSCAISFFHLNQAIYQHIFANKRKKLKQVRILSFVTDGKGNPVDDLSSVEDMLKDRVLDYDPRLWILAKGDAKSLYNFKNNGESLIQEGDEFYGGQSFQELMLLLDKQNHLRMVLSGTTEGMIRRMKEDMALLQKQYDKEASKKKK
jgi:cytochrome oxidase Cu insertion factor (SCO1/SenC/PrrC family)